MASIGLLVLGIALLFPFKPPIVSRSFSEDGLGKMTVAEPLWGAKGMVVIFADSRKFNPGKLSRQVAALNLTAATVDTRSFFAKYSANTEQCLDQDRLVNAWSKLLEQFSSSANKSFIGAVIPFIHAESVSSDNVYDVSPPISI